MVYIIAGLVVVLVVLYFMYTNKRNEVKELEEDYRDMAAALEVTSGMNRKLTDELKAQNEAQEKLDKKFVSTAPLHDVVDYLNDQLREDEDGSTEG